MYSKLLKQLPSVDFILFVYISNEDVLSFDKCNEVHTVK